MKKFILAVVAIFLTAATSEAGHRGRGCNCGGGQQGSYNVGISIEVPLGTKAAPTFTASVGTSTESLLKAPTPVQAPTPVATQAQAPTVGQSAASTQQSCGQGGCGSGGNCCGGVFGRVFGRRR